MSEIPGETHQVRRLLPDEADTTVAEQLAGLDLNELAHSDRPYLILNFATTLDGRAAISGRSGAIGSDTDTEMLQRLRTRVDAVMIGAGTMRAERYGRMVSDPDFRSYRECNRLTQDPLGVIVSNRFELPWDAGLFTDGGGQVVIFTASEEEPPETATQVTVVTNSYMSPHGTRCTASPRVTTPKMCAASPRTVKTMATWTQRPIPPASRPAPGPAVGVAGADVPGPGPGGVPGSAALGAEPTVTRSAAGSLAAFRGPIACRPKAKSHAKARTARA